MDAALLRHAFAEHKINKVKIGGFDVDGVLRGKYVALDKFWSAVESGLGFCDVIFGWDSSDVLYDNVQITGWQLGSVQLVPHTTPSPIAVPHTTELSLPPGFHAP